MQHTNTFTIIKAGPIFELSEWRSIILLQAANEYDFKKRTRQTNLKSNNSTRTLMKFIMECFSSTTLKVVL